jgi:hypothetical protein
MQPNTETHVHDPALPPALSPEFEGLLGRVLQCSRDEKRALLDRLLRDLIGDRPEREYGLYNPDGSSYLFLLPPPLRQALWETPEFLAELDQRSESRGKERLFSEVIAELESRQ